MTRHTPIDRRSVLQATGGALAGLGATGLVSADSTPVVVNVGVAAESGRKAALDAAGEVVRDFDSLPVVTVRVPRRAASELGKRPDVRYVEQNGRMHALAQNISWGIDRIDAPEAHPCAKGKGTDVAIIDTGIDGNHPDLEANLGTGAYAVSCSSWSAECTYSWGDDNGHGTHCAGIVGAVDNSQGVLGVAPEATIHAVKVLDSNGGGSYSDIAAGIEYVADQGWDIANLSLGGSASSAVKDAVKYADSKGVLMVAAAGNSGPCTDCVGYPAAYPETLAVSSIDSSDNLSGFSSTGPEINIAAPGSDIYSTYVGGGYKTLSGTSMAAPFVSGAAALLMGDPFNYTRFKTWNILCETAEDIGLSDDATGCGLVDVQAAVDC
ncbi:S8 family peptidase [Halorussus caseinilyticus]|uniref:S8 family peptidase n=1 Tax=Halorussus caseinilyticus TaxID=3034025 RepID=A0ABD5WIQ2_9EURY|nr:S8 family peptidase [Halorussus sp. DT72]